MSRLGATPSRAARSCSSATPGTTRSRAPFGEAPDAITIVESPEDVEATNFSADDQLVYLTQTTLSIDDANVIIDAIKAKYPHCKAPAEGRHLLRDNQPPARRARHGEGVRT